MPHNGVALASVSSFDQMVNDSNDLTLYLIQSVVNLGMGVLTIVHREVCAPIVVTG